MAELDCGQKSGGYNCILVHTQTLLQSDCPICLLVLRKPHMMSCCGHNFCRACIAVVQNKGESCPFCRTIHFTTMHNQGLERTLKSLIVKCEHELLGCTWSDELGKLDRHLEAVCSYVDVGCKHGCSTVTKRKDIAEHENQCGRRPFCCSYCNVYESTYDDVVTVHHLVCLNAPVPCPQGCNVVLECQHLQQHTDDVCPNTIVECDFSYYGCSAKLRRQDLPTHLNTNLSFHTCMSMLSKMNKQFLSEIQPLKAEVERLKAMEVPQLKAEVQQLKVDLVEVSQLKREVQELKRVLHEHKSQADAMTSYLKTSPTISQDVYMSTNIEPLKSLVHGQSLQQKNFYSHIGGYKMQLHIMSSTSGCPPNTVRLYPRVYLMKGEFDEFLDWPFEGVVTVCHSLSRDKLCINFSDVPQTRVLNRGGIAEKGVNSDSAIIVVVNRFHLGKKHNWGVFKVEKVAIRKTSGECSRDAASRHRPNNRDCFGFSYLFYIFICIVFAVFILIII